MSTPIAEAKHVLSAYWSTESVPVSPSRIAAAMGVAVLADPNMIGSGHYEPQGASGNPLITYNPNENYVRNRFTIAHELGHHVLGHGTRDRDNPIDFTLSSFDQKEVDANKFAAYLLMPADSVKAAIAIAHVDSVEDLAKMFQVSKPAMKFRLKELGYRV